MCGGVSFQIDSRDADGEADGYLALPDLRFRGPEGISLE